MYTVCMPLYTYSAAKQNGELVKGEREAETEKKLAELLKSDGVFLLEARLKQELGMRALFTATDLRGTITRFLSISTVDKMFFARNLSVMIAAGLSLTKSLDALSREAQNPKFRAILADINTSIAQGKSFADALRMHEKVFGELFINMIEVGETSGKLTLILKLLARQMKKDHDLKGRVRGAMMYPAIIIIAVTVIGTLMMIYVVPTLVQTITELGAQVPATTQFIIWLSNNIGHYGIYMLTAFIAFVYGSFRLLKTNAGKHAFDRAVLRIPVFGRLIKQFNVARFSRTLAYLITSGVPIVRALEITASILGNSLYQKAVKSSAEEIQKGVSLNALLAKSPNLFNPLVVQMVSVGEETGSISSMLLRIALFFEEDVNNATKNLSTLIEPVLMIIIGIAVGFFVISMLQPIYSSLGGL